VSYNINGIRYCNMHGRRVRRNGSPDVVQRIASYAGAECTVDGCTERPRRNDLCEFHSQQMRTWGDPLVGITMAADGEGSVRKDGYRMLTVHGHPLADKWGHVLEHRMVLFGKIGPGEHPCHWCDKLVTWDSGYSLTVDHVDANPSNNAPENLVPSCNPCNVRRSNDRRWTGPEPKPVRCGECGTGWQSRAKRGHWIGCPACKARNKVA
jgi:hypothetical protein